MQPESGYYDISEMVSAAYKAYQCHPLYENFDVGKRPSEEAILYQLVSRLVNHAKEMRFDLIIAQENSTYETLLLEEFDIGENLTCELKPVTDLEASDPTLYLLLKSLIKLLMKNKKLPSWVDQSEFIRSFPPLDDEGEEIISPELEASIDYYQRGTPMKWLKKLDRFKALPLSEIKKFSSTDELLMKIVSNAIKVIEHPHNFHDYVNTLDHDEGLIPYQYVFFSWDFNQPVDQHYADQLDYYFSNYDLIPARRIIPIRNSKAWLSAVSGDTFFHPLGHFFTSMREYFKTQ